MEIYYSEGGARDPYFQYRFKVREVTREMYEWCSNYDAGEHDFRRWHIVWNSNRGNDDLKEVPLIQFEWEEPAITFALMFGEYIL
jgi:hypothetical protein